MLEIRIDNETSAMDEIGSAEIRRVLDVVMSQINNGRTRGEINDANGYKACEWEFFFEPIDRESFFKWNPLLSSPITLTKVK